MSKTISCLIYAIVQAVVVLLVAIFALRLYAYDLRVPFSYGGDSVVILMYIKGLVLNGWPAIVEQLSAPFYFSGEAFPILTSVDWIFIKAISLMTKEPGYLLNGFWLLTLVLSAWIAAYAGYQLGLSVPFAFGSGVLYAFLPYALLRNVAHLNLVYYLVPVLCLLAVVIATAGAGVRNRKNAISVGVLGCVLQGFNYIYYSYFTVLLFFIASMIGYRKAAGYKQFALPVLAALSIVVAVGINMMPTFQNWSQNGLPPEMGYKHLAEAEIYGAKIRKMLSPHPDNTIKPLAAIAQKDGGAKFPNENENVTARLGLYGSVGFLLLIFFCLRAEHLSIPSAAAISALGVASLLTITVGGFGAVINLMTVPDIRAYNRYSVFLAFFSIVYAGLFFQEKIREAGVSKKYLIAVLCVFSVFSLYDQLLDKKALVASQATDPTRAMNERLVVSRLESILPAGSAVLQLPFTGFPPLATLNKMESYDHARPFIWSHHLKWSWPSFSQRHRAWQTRMSNLHGDKFIEAAIYSGFDSIWIDRFGYADQGSALINSLSVGSVRQLDVESDRFAVLDLREEAREILKEITIAEFRRRKEGLLGGEMAVEWGRGFYAEELNPRGENFRWATNYASLKLRNRSELLSGVCVSFQVASPNRGSIVLTINETDLPEIKVDTHPVTVKFPVNLESSGTVVVDILAQVERHTAPDDSRSLYFYIINFATQPLADAAACN